LSPSAPTAQPDTTVYINVPFTLRATGCTGSGFAVKWFKTSDNSPVTMPTSLGQSDSFYARCEQSANGTSCLSGNSANVLVNITNRIYVNAANIDATENGNTWATAFVSLVDGLNAAKNATITPVEVWVASGTYKPGITRQSYFVIPSGVKVFGGFAGTEALLNQRNAKTNVTILSGEIGSTASNDNTHHVVVFNATNPNTVLDGFTITRGFANFVSSASNLNTPDLIASGGGVLAVAKAKGQIINCTITDNKAIFGGGIFQQDTSEVQVINSTIWNNEATFGGAAYQLTKSTPTYTNCLIVQNKAGVGGIIYNNDSNPSLMNCTIASNDGGGVGVIFNTKSTPTIVNSILWGNSNTQFNAASVITHSVVEGGFTGTGNLSTDPKLANAAPFGLALLSPLGDYRLLACSPAINAGTSTGAPTTDIAGNARPQGAGIDMGVYEGSGLVSPPTLDITANISTGTSTYTAGKITATNQVSNANVTYTAGQSVTLLPGFKAEGTVFTAQIGSGCN
jgi:hypothetical protein